jgi:pimeloyl-ACP methyl ester carboxylesterase
LVAQELALSYPERVRGLILAETMYGLSSTLWDAAAGVMMNVWLPQMLGVNNYLELISNFFGMYTPGGVSYIRQELQRHLDDEKNQQNILRASLNFDSRWRLHQIDCPTLLLVGQYPHIPAILWHNWEMYWRINQANLTFIPNAGHMLYWDNPAAFNEAVQEFVSQI